jgi:hypothetical protein
VILLAGGVTFAVLKFTSGQGGIRGRQ